MQYCSHYMTYTGTATDSAILLERLPKLSVKLNSLYQRWMMSHPSLTISIACINTPHVLLFKYDLESCKW